MLVGHLDESCINEEAETAAVQRSIIIGLIREAAPKEWINRH